MKKILFISVVSGILVAALGFLAPALATHNSFVIGGTATTCYTDSGADAIDHSGPILNELSSSIYVDCPADLSGQFNGAGSLTGEDNRSAYAIQIHATIPAVSATVWYNDQNTADHIECTAWIETETRSMYYSATQASTNSGTGPGSLTIANAAGWGGTLGSGVSNIAARSFLYECSIPGLNMGWGAPSAILGYSTRICANNNSCTPT
jgi:hypothetical protein